MNIKLLIENIIEQDNNEFELSKLFKEYIKRYKLSLNELFKETQGKDFLVKHTKKLDFIIELMYKSVLRKVFKDYMPMRSSIPIGIVALGSYGREQLCVHSDIDILIVYEEVSGYNTQEIIEKFFYLALDSGLKLGHRVHRVDELFDASNDDITIKTALLESRFVTGSSMIWSKIQTQLKRIRLYNQKAYILAKITEAQKRRKRYPTSMQPNIKEGVGGLRDANLLFWIAHIIYGVKNLKDLSGVLFDESKYREYRMALELIFRVRSALHLVANKQEDRLLFDFMPQVSSMLGFKNEQKMVTKVLQAEWRVSNFTQIFVKKMVRAYLYDFNFAKKMQRLQKGIYLLDNRIFASYNLHPQPINSLLELLLNLEDKRYHFDAGFLRQWTYTKITYPLKPKTYMLLKELFYKKHLYCFLKLFLSAGVLHKLFLNFKKVMFLPQFDGYHQYAVDMHSIKAVEALEDIKDEFVKKLYDGLSDDERMVLKLVVLFHDSGKGRKQEHGEVGAKLINQFAKKIKLKDELTKRAVVLVKNHTLMSDVAFRENIHNEKTLYKFMSNIQDETNLKLLYILTYADINGVGEGVFNSFNSKLLFELYTLASEASQNPNRITDATKRLTVEKRVKNLDEFKVLPKTLQKKILTIESNLFFFRLPPQEIIQNAKMAKEVKEFSFNIKNKNSLIIEIFRKVPLNIGYLLAKLNHLDVASMDIFTIFDDVKYFKIEFIKNIDDSEIGFIKQIIINAFDMSKEAKLPKVSIKKDEIDLDCNHSKTYAELSIHTANQRGLLAYIMTCFENLNINVATAKIYSTKYKVKDSFLIQKQNNICDNTEKIFSLLASE